MGNCVLNSIKESQGSDQDNIEDLFTKNSFEKLYIVGRGGFGRVWKVQSKKYTYQSYALKEMSKARVIAKKSLDSVFMERALLSKINHNFIVNMKSAFSDRENLYLVLDYCSGGDLRYHLPHKFFNEEETKFMIACLILALEYLHGQGIVHRDIKPENMVFDEKGFLKLTDFGISRLCPGLGNSQLSTQGEELENTKGVVDTSGTPGYMSPEAMCKLPHGQVSDFFALGVIVYEMMFRKRPYNGQNKQQIRDNILAKQVQIKAYEVPSDWSIESADFTNKLIRRKPQSRLGYLSGVIELKSHPWFKDFDWQALLNKKMQAPWVPPKGDNYKGKNIDFYQEDQNALLEGEKMLRRDTVQRLFDGYFFESKHQQYSLSFQKEKEKQKQKCLIKIKEQNNNQKNGRNSILLLNKLSPQNSRLNQVVNFELSSEQDFIKKAGSPSHMRSGSSASTAFSSKSKGSFIKSHPLLKMNNSPTSSIAKK